MRLTATALLLLAALAAGHADDKPAAPPPKKATFTISKETTHVTGPLDKDGRIDYAAALNERLSKGVTPDTNAVVLLMQAIGPRPEGSQPSPEFFRLLGVTMPPEKGDYFIGLIPFARGRLSIPADDEERRTALFDQQSQASQWPWTADQYPDVAAWLTANEKPLAVVAEAVRRPRYYYPLMPNPSSGLLGGSLSGVQMCREIAAALSARAMLRVGRGDADGAWQDLLTCHRLGRQVGRGATLIESLVGYAIESIAARCDLVFLERTKPDAKRLAGCFRDLQTLPPSADIADKIDLAERFVCLENVMLLDRKGIEFKDVFTNKLYWWNFEAARQRLNWDLVLSRANEGYDRLAATLREPDRAARVRRLKEFVSEARESRAPFADEDARIAALRGSKDPGQTLAEMGGGGVMVGLTAALVPTIPNAADRARQGHGNLVLAFALARYRLDHGRYPKELAALAPKYVPAVPNDLFSDKPLVYRPTDTGYTLHSVGVNGKDDAGRGRDDDPPGDDLSVHMPVPEPKK